MTGMQEPTANPLEVDQANFPAILDLGDVMAETKQVAPALTNPDCLFGLGWKVGC